MSKKIKEKGRWKRRWATFGGWCKEYLPTFVNLALSVKASKK